MQFGAAMFFTDASMTPGELGPLLEQRGFESLWVPEHSHIPLVRTKAFPGGPELPRPYYDIMDPFLVLTATAVATKTLKVGTGVCLINQRDPIQTAKQVASLDQLSGGRFLFGVGNGWNKEEMEHHGTNYDTRHKLSRERIEAMKAIWSHDTAEYHGEFVNFAPMQTWPKSVARSRTAPAARYATATAGSPAQVARGMATSRKPCRNSTRWRRRQGAPLRRSQSRCSVSPRILINCTDIAILGSPGW
jgi:probable F420-dependent oxidoreductase